MAEKDTKKPKISLESYKGVRDFYPEDMFVENYIFDAMRKTAESFGYVEYGASILEPTELYKSKTSEEIVNEQTYAFKDRGGREVTLRPEMTPSVARMVAARRRELSLPLRWYSIPNVFRYEQPQRGRLREHWQLNVDLFGLDTIHADTEVVSVAYELLTNLGAKAADFEIRINSRALLDELWSIAKLTAAEKKTVGKILDKKDKIGAEVFMETLSELLGKRADLVIKAVESGNSFAKIIGENNKEIKRLETLIEYLEGLDVKNVRFTPSLVRGFDYYTGFVFEIFDMAPENRRSLFGGGRYDNLLADLGGEKIPAVGFGAGDVPIRDFLLTHGLLPVYESPADLFVAVIGNQHKFADALSQKLRDAEANVVVDWSNKSVGDKVKKALRDKVPYFAAIGDNEADAKKVTIKNLGTKKERELPLDDTTIKDIAKSLKNGTM